MSHLIPIKTALCSFGMSGKVFHAPFLSVNNAFTLHGAWERSNKFIQEQYESAISYDSYEELLADQEVELVIINTPNVTHYEFAKKALLAGKHVVIEKPFTVSAVEGEALIQIAHAQKKKLSGYQNRRYDSDFLTVKHVLQKKLLGDIVEAELHFDRFMEVLSYKAHKEKPEKGTGLVYDLGSHLIDQALQLFGYPTAVFADISIMRTISKVDDYFEILLYYPSLRVRVRSTLVAREPSMGYTIHGSKGSFVKPKTNVQEEALLAGILPLGQDWGKEHVISQGLLHTEKNGEIIKEKIDSLQGNYMDYFDGIYHAIRKGGDVPVLPEDSVNAIRIIEAAFESSITGCVVKL
ncbi:Gfo/Idh/MocA family oxidoreductase [Parasediminibacterium sp. JCM 36343]|uniref:Gfo/Idh/MocA family oxidoreductase n=1 Tax=Parasediminibacterium sp. JCM 36343 TaxID=3374279 RepID=UPI00397BA4C2